MKNKIEFGLKQHTPIIHFQHDQNGATLRASELKPKIDRFIIHELKEINKEIYAKYKDLINKGNFPFQEKVPSKYKIRIIAASTDKPRLMNFATAKPKSPYFGDLLAIQNNNIKIEIFGFNKRLVELVVSVLPYIFVYNNFGTRQSKGFGSFLPHNMNRDAMQNILFKKYDPLFLLKLDDSNGAFEDINKNYQLLKSGLNYPKYHKSKLFKYMCSKGARWEKRKIKEQLKRKYPSIFGKLAYSSKAKQNRIADCDSENNNREYRYIRAMLGLSENYEYKVDNTRGNTDVRIKKVKIRINDEKNEIQRFRSPITFKVFEDYIYVLPNTIDPIMFDRDFRFDLNVEYENKNDENVVLFVLKTPSNTRKKNDIHFDLIDFLKFSKLFDVLYSGEVKQ